MSYFAILCRMWTQLIEFLFGSGQFHIVPRLYYNKHGLFSMYLSSPYENLLLDTIEKKHHERGFKNALVMTQPLVVKSGDYIEAHLWCIQSDVCEIDEERFSYKVPEDMDWRGYISHDFIFCPLTPDQHTIFTLKFSLSKNGDVKTENKILLDWPLHKQGSAMKNRITIEPADGGRQSQTSDDKTDFLHHVSNEVDAFEKSENDSVYSEPEAFKVLGVSAIRPVPENTISPLSRKDDDNELRPLGSQEKIKFGIEDWYDQPSTNDAVLSKKTHPKNMGFGKQKPEPTIDIKVAAKKRIKGFIVEFKDQSVRKTYEVCIEPSTFPENKIIMTTTKQRVIVPDLVPGEAYRVSVLEHTLIDEDRSIIGSSDGYTLTLPDKVKNLKSRFENDCIVFEWDPLEIEPDMYIVQRKINNKPAIEEETESTQFLIHHVKANHWYYVRVMASNDSGRGPMTEWTTFKSGSDLELCQVSKRAVSKKKHQNPDDGRFLRNESVTEATRGSKILAQKITLSPRLLEQLQATHVKLSDAFTIDDNECEKENIDVTAVSYCTCQNKEDDARLLKVDDSKWSDVGAVPIGNEREISCKIEPNKTYILSKPLAEDMSGLRFHVLCRTAVDQSGKLSVKISMDDGVSASSQKPSLEQRFTMKIKDALDVKITRESAVLIDWQCILESKSLEMAKSVQLDNDEIKKDIICSIYRRGKAISQGILSMTRPCNEIEIKMTDESEKSLFVRLATTYHSKGNLNYVVKSLSSGKEISVHSKENFAILHGIDAGDKYLVSVFELVKGSPDFLIAKSEIQTRKAIDEKGGTVIVGGCALKFPKGAVRSRAYIKVCSNPEDAPCIPQEYLSITSIYGFHSTQKIFDAHVTCVLTTPYIKVEDPVEVDIICYKNHEWQKISSSYLTKEKTIKFRCNHFCEYAAVIKQSFSEISLKMSFDMVIRVYCNVSENFYCITCLNHPAFIHRYHDELVDSGYFLTGLMITSIEMKLGESAEYLMESRGASFDLSVWKVALDEAFVTKPHPWCGRTYLEMDVPDRTTRYVRLVLKRTHRQTEEIFRVKMAYPLYDATPPKPSTTNITTMYLNQGKDESVRIGGSRNVAAQVPKS